MGTMSHSQNRFASLFGSETVTQMNLVFNRLYWPVLIFFMFKEKTSALGTEGVITISDFKNNLFWNVHTREYLKDLIITKRPIIKKDEDMYEKTKYRLTPFGRKMAMMMWNLLEHISKSEGKSIEEYCLNIRKTLEIEPAAVDEEEEMLKRIEEENAKKAEKAGVIKKENGDAVIDLDKVVI